MGIFKKIKKVAKKGIGKIFSEKPAEVVKPEVGGGQAGGKNKAKFKSGLLTSFMKSGKTNSVNIDINFLGSGWLASDPDYNYGGQYATNEHVYYRAYMKGDVLTLELTFSGPTMLDVVKPTVKSLTKDAKEILSDLISNFRLAKEGIKIEIAITGHSRGGVIAQGIHKWLASEYKEKDGVELKSLSLADPYAGPFNRIFHQAMDNFDKEVAEVSTDKITVYTANEKRFRTPAKNLKSGRIVFTDATHDNSKFVVYRMSKNLGKYGSGVYICPLNNALIDNEIASIREKEGGFQEALKIIDKHVEENLEPIDDKNIDDVLNGRGGYANFSYSKLASDGRRKVFYKVLAAFYEDQVVKFLTDNKYKSMAKEISGRQERLRKKSNGEEKTES